MPKQSIAVADVKELSWPRRAWVWYQDLHPVLRVSVPSGLALGALGWAQEMLGNDEFGAALALVVLFTMFAIGALRQCRFTSKIMNVGIALGILAIAVYFSALTWQKKGNKPWSTLWSEPSETTIVGPTFRESLKEIKCLLGPLTITPDQIGHSEYACLRFENYSPFTFKKKGNSLLVDAVVYGLDGKTNAEVKENEITIRPELDWDLNWSDTALEIVDETQKPVLQIIYQTPSRVRVNGVFPTGTGQYVLLTNSIMAQGPIGSPVPPEADEIPRLFKYPGWRHRGEYQ